MLESPKDLPSLDEGKPLSSEDVLRPQWPEGVQAGASYEVLCDDKGRKGGSWLRLMVSPADSDVHLMMQDWEDIPNDEPEPIPCIRIRTRAGGGRNQRTRQALLWLAEAIRLDALEAGTTASVTPPAE